MTRDWRWKRSAALDAASFYYAANRDRGLDLDIDTEDDPDVGAEPYAPPRPHIRLHAFGALYVGEVDGVVVGVGLAFDAGPGRVMDASWMWVPGRRIPNDPRPPKYITGDPTPPAHPGLRATKPARVATITRWNRAYVIDRIEAVLGGPPRWVPLDDARRAEVERMRARTFVGHEARQAVRRATGR